MNKTTKNSIIYLAGSIVMGILGIVSSMLLTRILAPTEFGIYGKLITFSSTAVTLISFGYDLAYTRFYYVQGYTQKKYMQMSVKYPLMLFAVFAAVMLLPNFPLAKAVLTDDITIITVLLILVYFFAELIHKFTQLTARMEEHAVNYILSSAIAKSGFLIIVGAVYILSGEVSFNWIVSSFAISCILAVIINLFIFARVANKKTGKDTPVTNRDLLSYGWPYMVNNTLVLIIPLIEKLVIEEVGGEELLGIFTAAAIFQTVVLILTNTITNIWNPLVYKHCENEKVFKPILHSFGIGATIVSMLGLAACILLRRWLVLILGPEYHQVSVIAPSVLFGALFHILTIIYSVGINIKKKTYHFIISPIIQAVISFTLCFALIPKMELIGIAIASLASLIISKTYRISVGLHYYGSGRPEWKAALLCVTGVAASVVSMFLTSLLWDVIVSAAVIAATIIIINKEFLPLISTVKSIIKPTAKKEEKGL